MTRVLVCCALQIFFVAFYGAWSVFRPEEAFAWMPQFVLVVLALMIYNSWEPIREALDHWRNR